MADYCPLTADGLHEAATAQTGLTDFGEQDYRERMSVLLQAFEEIPHFTAFGRTYAFSLMLTFLKGRLRVIDHLKRHPEIFDIDIAAPMIIAGLPRTGTTHLHSMLAADPALRALPYWEAQEPLPPPGEEWVTSVTGFTGYCSCARARRGSNGRARAPARARRARSSTRSSC